LNFRQRILGLSNKHWRFAGLLRIAVEQKMSGKSRREATTKIFLFYFN
jgi:hypothetical protein